MSSMVLAFACALVVFAVTAVASEWAARRLVSRIDERLWARCGKPRDED